MHGRLAAGLMKACGASLMKDGGKQFERGLRGRRKLHEEANNGWKRRQVEEKIEKRGGEGVSFFFGGEPQVGCRLADLGEESSE
jgi:hypothetical protein